MARTQSARADGYANSVGVLPSSSARSRTRHQQQVPLYETSDNQSMYTSPPSQQQVNATVPLRRVATSQIVPPTTYPLSVYDGPFAQTPSREKPGANFAMSPTSDGLVDENARRRLDSVSNNDSTPTSTLKATTTTSSTQKMSNAGGLPPDQGQRRKKDSGIRFRWSIMIMPPPSLNNSLSHSRPTTSLCKKSNNQSTQSRHRR